MPFSIAGWIQIYLKQVKLLIGIEEEIEAEEFKASVLVLDLAGIEDGVGDDEVGLLVVAIHELVGRS